MLLKCLHSAASNVAIFDAAARHLGLPDGTLEHFVRPELLFAAEAAGGLTPQIADDTAAILSGLAANADAVLLTCSTLGPVADAVAPTSAVPVIRIDRALAEEAAAKGGTVVALCAVETTLEATRRVFEEEATKTGATADIRLVPGAWERFRAGDTGGYLAAVATAADAAYADGASIVALAQASMAGAARSVRNGPTPLTSPAAGLAAAMARCASR
ncbi:hypothetical protein GGD81_001508 [Rhodobium orientis]|uniref:Asp/Glu racemase n=1 Tax=Rhodobium orientis TaxID=34017 RepID=A0A327JSU2_9HYPH|nr:aspartate/glutamate racemase family protein [Rhodobium orientis]MBB4302478.1 hypothetical protein [Rhodobium orientis]MBK5949327.1 Asp/Glu racemase [Rhodobium orientis]RAI28695.1 Asp/Glu racemase [Rhodobium orientis]